MRWYILLVMLTIHVTRAPTNAHKLFVHIEATVQYLCDTSTTNDRDVWMSFPQKWSEDDNWFKLCYQLASLPNVPKVIFTQSSKSLPATSAIDNMATPLVLIVIVNQEQHVQFLRWLDQIAKQHMRMKLIVATDVQNRSVMGKLINAILITEHHDTVFMIHNYERNESRAHTYHPYRKEFATHRIDEYHTFFPDYERNYHRKPVLASSMPAVPYIITLPASKWISGIDSLMLQVIGQMANISFHLKANYETRSRSQFPTKIKDIGAMIWLNRLVLRSYYRTSVTTPDMSGYVIIVPRGQRLTIPETFLRPLTTAAWILVIVIVVVSFLVMWNFNRYFRNDLILLPVCGIERYNLNQAHFGEKLLVLGLMVFYFLLQSGYESIIISLIVDVPYHPDILTFEQLRDSKMPVTMSSRYDVKFLAKLLEQHQLPIENETMILMAVLREEKASLHDYRSGKILIKDFYEHTNQRKRFNLLQDTLSAHPTSYLFRHRTRVQETFERHMHTIFEAGLLNHWAEHYQKLSKSRMKVTPPSEDDELVKFGDLAPFWAVIGVGWSISIFVFLLERFTTLQLEVKLKAARGYHNGH